MIHGKGRQMRINGPMRLADGSGQVFEFSIEGYQFPEILDGWDANWLVVAGHGRRHDTEWRFRDPCLTTTEARELASWLRLATAPVGSEPNPIYFTEPNLAFAVADRSASAVWLRMIFELEARPDLPQPVDWGEFSIDLELTPADLEYAADDLARELEAFPVRR